MTSKYEPAHDAGADLMRFADPDHRERDRRKIAERGDGCQTGPKILDFGDREGGVLDAEPWRALADVDRAGLRRD